jgi:uncharacterized membrane protein YhaH (DUF805 family)
MNWYTAVLKKYAVFNGRARRKEYWMFVLFNVIIALVLFILELITNSLAITVLYYIYGLAVLVPSLAVTVRRLHDTNRTGWWIFIGLVPFVGEIILLVFVATDGNSGDNQYGPDPKAGSNIAATPGAA